MNPVAAVALLLVGLTINGCATLNAASPDLAATLQNQLLGEYNNHAQMQALPASVSRVPARSGEWLDAQHAKFVAFNNPEFGPHPVFFEWRSPDPQGTVTRRRIWAFETVGGNVQMQFYSFKDEAMFGDASRWQSTLATLNPADLVRYPDGCTVLFERSADGAWRGLLNPITCKILAQRSGKELSLGATIEITANTLYYREQGRYADGTTAFVVPGKDVYQFERVNAKN
jgi:CpeT/CpcT family (DUF1001)